MKNLFTLTLCVFSLSSTAQDECTGPDFNHDGQIGSVDLEIENRRGANPVLLFE